MSTLTSVDGRTATLLLQHVSDLHSTFTPVDFQLRLEGVLQALLGTHDFTLVAATARGGSVLHSTRLADISERLEPPRVELARLDALVRHFEPPGAAASTIEIEGQQLPVHAVWRLGAGGQHAGTLLFHASPNGADTATPEVIDELRRATSVAFFKVQDRLRTLETIDLHQAKLQAINEVGELLGTLDIDVLLTKLMELSLYVANAPVGSIILVRDGEYTSGVEWGLPLEMASRLQTRTGEVLFERVLASGEPALILDFGECSEYRIDAIEVQVGSYLCVPLIAQNRTLGVINLVHPPGEQSSFSELDRDILMTISGLAATSISNAMLHADSLEKERYRQSLAIARTIQMRLFPSSVPPFPTLDVAWNSESCDETGGDYVDFIATEDGRFIAVVGDVSGHGIGSALLMAAARAGLRASLRGDRPLSQVIGQLNDQLEHDMEIDRFMTMFVIAFGPAGGAPAFVNAGHDSPILYRAATGTVEELPSTGMPLGIFAGNPYDTGTLPALTPGDALLITTDGVWEVPAADGGEMLGKQRLMEIFRRQAGRPASEALLGVLAEVNAYTGGPPARDDVTLVVLRAV